MMNKIHLDFYLDVNSQGGFRAALKFKSIISVFAFVFA